MYIGQDWKNKILLCLQRKKAHRHEAESWAPLYSSQFKVLDPESSIIPLIKWNNSWWWMPDGLAIPLHTKATGPHSSLHLLEEASGHKHRKHTEKSIPESFQCWGKARSHRAVILWVRSLTRGSSKRTTLKSKHAIILLTLNLCPWVPNSETENLRNPHNQNKDKYLKKKKKN